MAEHYNKQIVESRTEKKREEKKQQMEQALGDLISLHEDVVDAPEVDEDFEDLQGSADKISDEEREKRKEELEDMNSSDLSREFGLDS
jgi:glutamyl-tRNA reductase